MSRGLTEFLRGFASPLLRGGVVEVAGPVGGRGLRAMARELPDNEEAARLTHAVARGAQRLGFDAGAVVAMQPAELGLVTALHDLLALEHPDRERVWSSRAAWARLVDDLRARGRVAAQASDRTHAAGRSLAISRAVWVDALTRLAIVHDAEVGRALHGAGEGGRGPTKSPWWSTAHRPEVALALRELLFGSRELLWVRPELSPTGWSVVHELDAVRHPADLRAIAFAWSRGRGWAGRAGRVAANLMTSAGEPVAARSPQRALQEAALQGDHGAGIGRDAAVTAVALLVHTQWLRAAEGARVEELPLGRTGVPQLLALCAAARELASVTGWPTAPPPDLARLSDREREDLEVQRRRFDRWCDAVPGVVGAATMRTTRALLERWYGGSTSS